MTLAASHVDERGTERNIVGPRALRLVGLLIGCTFTVTSFAGITQARTWRITAEGSGDAPTIQAGIDSASTGDSIVVAPGIYYENLDTKGKGLALLGTTAAEFTVIDGAQQGRVISLDSGGSVERFTIRNGLAEEGAGIRILGPGPCSIRDNIIEENVALNELGGGWGGGISHLYHVVTDDIFIENNLIRGNLAQLGGGIFQEVWSSGVHVYIRANRVEGNRVSWWGGGINATYATIEENLIVGNVAGITGGGIAFRGDAIGGEIRRNTIAGNRTLNGVPNGAGVQAAAGVGGITIANNLVWENHGPTGGPASGAGIDCRAGEFVVSCNLLWGNDIDLNECTPVESNNISQAPQFCGVDPVSSMNFYIQSDSPCAPGQSGTCGLIGALPVGCGTVGVQTRTWSFVKDLYR